ncbi:MAG: oligosaccharide flippase family protein [Planctomycetota bacterium]
MSDATTNPDPVEPPDDDTRRQAERSALGKQAVKGSAWTLMRFGAGQLLRFISNVVFTYLLFPEAFATMMIVNAVIQGLQMFSDIGIGPSVVQHARGDDRRFLNTAFTMQVVRGGVLALVCLALTYPAAAFYAEKDPAAWDLLRLLPFTALSLFINGFQSTKIHTASRHLSLARVTMLDLASQVAGIVVTMAYALIHRDVLALVLGALCSAIVRTVGSHLMLPGESNRFGWERSAVKSIVGFGGWIFFSTIASFFAMQLDRLVFPRAFAFGDSGVYSIAANLAGMVPAVVGSLQLAVVFPLYSRMAQGGHEIGPQLQQVKRAVYAVAGLLLCCVIAGSDAMVRLVYASEYHEAAWMMSLLAVGAWFQIIESMYGAALLARGCARLVAFANAAKPIAFAIWFACVDEVRIVDAIVVWTLADVLKGVVAMWGASQQRVLTLGLDLRMTALALGSGGVLWWGAQQLREALEVPPMVELPLVGVVALLMFLPVLLPGIRTLKKRKTP